MFMPRASSSEEVTASVLGSRPNPDLGALLSIQHPVLVGKGGVGVPALEKRASHCSLVNCQAEQVLLR